MKYIDAEKILAVLERQNVDKKVIQPLIRIIDSLQQEQKEKKEVKFVFPKFLYARTTNNKTIDVSYAPQSLDAVEYIRSDSLQQEQPGTSVIEVTARCVYESWMGGTMNDVRRHMNELGRVLNVRKED